MALVEKEPHNFTVRFRQMCVVTKGKGAQEATTAMIDLLCMGPFKTPCRSLDQRARTKHVCNHIHQLFNLGLRAIEHGCQQTEDGNAWVGRKKDTKHIENDDKVSAGRFD